MKFQRILNPGTINNRPVFIKLCVSDDDVLSLSGVIGPYKNGNAYGSCGQIMDFMKEQGFFINDQWSYDLIDYLSAVWKNYHLNDMQAGCNHQQLMGLEYAKVGSVFCPICGYALGTEWKSKKLPTWLIESLEKFPASKLTPNWI